jgi:hypothetical protein
MFSKHLSLSEHNIKRILTQTHLIYSQSSQSSFVFISQSNALFGTSDKGIKSEEMPKLD